MFKETKINPDRFAVPVSRIVDALDQTVAADMSYAAAIGEIINELTEYNVTYANSVHRDGVVRFDDTGIKVERDGVMLWAEASLAASDKSPDATIPVDHDEYDVVVIDTDHIYHTITLTADGE